MLLFALPVAVSAVVGFFLVSTPRRYGILVGLGVAAAVVLLVVSYLVAPTSPGGCSDCGEYFGRWWEPALTVFFLVLLLVAWAVGLAVGAGLREYSASRRKPIAHE
ncbi:MAG: hypothetical protein AABM30_02605 [Actinomycetota bacterium]